MAGEEWLQIHKGIRERSEVEDLLQSEKVGGPYVITLPKGSASVRAYLAGHHESAEFDHILC